MRFKLWTWLWMVLIITAILCACAGGGGGENFTASQVPSTYSVSGQVTLSGSGQSGVTVSLTGQSNATTDSSGNFSFTDIANGAYTLAVSKSGYIFSPNSYSVTVSGGNVMGKNFSSAVSYAGQHIFAAAFSGFSGDDLAMAGRYEALISNDDMKSDVATIKSINSNMMTLWYRDALTYPTGGTDTYLKDKAGNCLVASGWGDYLHDPGNSTYRSTLASYASSYLSTNTQFSGVLLDDVWSTLNTGIGVLYEVSCSTGNPTGNSWSFNDSDVTNWVTNMQGLINAVKTAVGSKPVIVNTGWATQSQYDQYADGMVDENFAHAPWDDATTFLDTTSWNNHLSAMINAQSNNKYYFANSGVSNGATSQQIAQLSWYCYTSWLMGVSSSGYGKHYFTPNPYVGDYWFSQWAIVTGTPKGSYSNISGYNSYSRVFANGLAIVNPTDTPETVNLGTYYKDQNGNTINSINMGARTGTFLYNTN